MLSEREREIVKEVSKLLLDTMTLAEPPLVPARFSSVDSLQTLYAGLLSLRDLLYSASNGDLSREVPFKGYIGGALKTLQSNLRHITWQTNRIASGDFTQRIEFMGEFSQSFNAMVMQLDQTLTERKRAEEKLRESEQFIRRILDTVDECFIVIDRDFRIVTANMAYCRQYGIAFDDVIGRHCYEISHKSLRPCFEEGEDCPVHRAFDEGESCAALHRHPDAKGDILYVETKAFPIKDNSGAFTSVIETVQNITEKFLLEEERLKTQKLEAIGTLAGGIAHDFNNLLQGVFGYISMVKITLDDKKRSLAMLEQAEKALHMSVNLTTQLLTFSKGGKPLKKKIPLESVIDNSVRFALSGSRSGYRINLDTDLWHVEADEGQIGQVIQNIVLNAEQAMPLGGTIVIAGKNVLTGEKGIPRLPEEGKYVEISVQDSGIGIPEEYLPKIFDPYFTTKAKGSGLGLATCYSIIKNHGGAIHVSSKIGKGATFYVYLPAIQAEKETPQIPGLSPFVRKGKILLMDDEEMIRDLAGEMIRVLGHKVELAQHGEEAIEKYKAAMGSGNPFDIVILDLTIRGGMGGEETIERLLAVDPKIRAIVSSGFSDDSVVSDYHNYGFNARLTKPYKLQELSDTLNNLLVGK
ncbi:MAG: ATP-binding protein [Dissulfurispiraceae bacterium]|jgi:PAS domain S-box-containing protein